MYHFVLWCTFRDFAVTLSFLDCYRWFSHILNDTLRSVPSNIILPAKSPISAIDSKHPTASHKPASRRLVLVHYSVSKIGAQTVRSRHCISTISNAAIDKRAIPFPFRACVLLWEVTIRISPSTTKECFNSFWLFACSISTSKSPSPLVSRKPFATMCSP